MKLSSPWQLALETVQEYWRHLGSYLLIAAIIVVPFAGLSLLGDISESPGFNAYSTITAIIMYVALLHAIILFHKDGGRWVSPASAYYGGSAAIVPFLLLSWLLSMMVLPLVAALMVFLYGTYPVLGSTISVGEQVIIGLLAIILAVPTFWWLTRFAVSIYGVVSDGLRPVAALTQSRQFTLGRFWQVFARLAFMVFCLALVLLFIYAPIYGLAQVVKDANQLYITIYLLLVNLTAIPLLNIYLHRLYLALKSTAKS